MENFKIGDEVIFRNHSLLMSGRITECISDKNGQILKYFIKTIDSNFFTVIYNVDSLNLIRTVLSLDELEL